MKKLAGTLCLILAVLFYSVAGAQDMFLKVEAGGQGPYSGLFDGESTILGHEREIIVLSYSHGIAGCPPGSSTSSCKSSFSGLNIMIEMTKSLINFKHYAATGKVVQSVDFVIRKAGATPFDFYKVRMEGVTINSVQESGSSGGGGKPMISVELTATKIAYLYIVQGEAGQVVEKFSFGWDIAQNKAWTYAPFNN
jgi:type VI secretion system secreted protein Hcp